MKQTACFEKGVKKGAWSALEDQILNNYIKIHGEGNWKNVPVKAGLRRCRKSCRLRWLNYLKPDIRRGNITPDEVDLILRLHKLLGNRWSLIAGRLPGRTDNEIKNYWNTKLSKMAKRCHNPTMMNSLVLAEKVHGDGFVISSNKAAKAARTKRDKVTRDVLPRTFMENANCSRNSNLVVPQVHKLPRNYRYNGMEVMEENGGADPSRGNVNEMQLVSSEEEISWTHFIDGFHGAGSMGMNLTLSNDLNEESRNSPMIEPDKNSFMDENCGSFVSWMELFLDKMTGEPENPLMEEVPSISDALIFP